jgi:hypothetical protein
LEQVDHELIRTFEQQNLQLQQQQQQQPQQQQLQKFPVVLITEIRHALAVIRNAFISATT